MSGTTQTAAVTEDHPAIADTIVRGIAEFATGITYDDLTDEAVRAAKRCLVDAIGCGLAAQRTELIEALHSVARTQSSDTPARLFGSRVATTPEMAAFANGSAIRCLDFNDDYFGTDESPAKGDNGPHPSDSVGAILAAVQMTGGDGRAALLGSVVSYEVVGQLVDRVVLRSNGWDHPIFHAVATAASASTLLGLTIEQAANAVRLAVTPNICTHETRIGTISNWKGLAGPNSSRNGLFGALVARSGVTGPEMAFEGAEGFMRQVGHQFTLGKFGGYGRRFRVEDTYFKHLPLRYEMQLPVQMAFELRQKVDPAQIAELKVFMERKCVASREAEPNLWRPLTRETADHSGPFLIASALVDGYVDARSFEQESLSKAAVLEVIDTIEMIEDPAYTETFPWPMSCRFELVLKNGETITLVGENPKGHPRNALTDEELSEKFLLQVRPKVGEERARELLATIWSLEAETSLDRLFDLMVFDN